MSFIRSSSLCLALGTLAATAPVTRADTAVLTPAADATLFEPLFKDAYRASGSGQFLYIGHNHRDKLRRAIVRFDLSSIPAGATIASVTLRVSITRTFSVPADVGLYVCTSTWGEGASDSGNPGGIGTDPEVGDATWVTAFWPDTFWTTPGGDFLPDLRASTTLGDVGTDATFLSTPELVADVQAWLDTPAANSGWLIHNIDEKAIGVTHQIASRENELPELRPTLTVEYTPGGGPECLADFNDDGIVNSTDVSDFINQWFQDQIDGTFLTDWDDNGVINSTDVSNFINDWFAAPPECTG